MAAPTFSWPRAKMDIVPGAFSAAWPKERIFPIKASGGSEDFSDAECNWRCTLQLSLGPANRRIVNPHIADESGLVAPAAYVQAACHLDGPIEIRRRLLQKYRREVAPVEINRVERAANEGLFEDHEEHPVPRQDSIHETEDLDPLPVQVLEFRRDFEVGCRADSDLVRFANEEVGKPDPGLGGGGSGKAQGENQDCEDEQSCRETNSRHRC